MTDLTFQSGAEQPSCARPTCLILHMLALSSLESSSAQG